jgi:N6-L-threonylcarbamoyladenine synthase
VIGVSEYILGIDTSNYTTSLCIVDPSGSRIWEARKLLSVAQGERGLQQSQALFQHVQNLPDLFSSVIPDARQIKAIAVSTRPRPRDRSYMPVFLAGKSIAYSLAAVLGIPVLETTHQEGHIAAGEGTSGEVPAERFFAIHISGGTTDLLIVNRKPYGYEIEELGSSRDLHAGQFVDRIGVALGLPFPAGPHLEKLAAQSSNDKLEQQNRDFFLPSPVKGYNLSFSGPETKALRAIEQRQVPPQIIARAVENCIAKGLEKVILSATQEFALKHALIVGGVAANQWIRERLVKRLEHPAVGMKLWFADPRYSTDNAFGVARIGLKWYKRAIGRDIHL